MDHVEAVADTITSWTRQEGADTVLRLSNGGQLTIRQTDPRSKAWGRVIALQEEKHWPVYVEFEVDSRVVRQLLLCTPREVEAVQPQTSGDVTVLFRRAPSFYTLKNAQSHFDATLALLRASAQKRTSLFITVQPTTLEILYAHPLNGK